jgi:hypothetical protein
LKKIWCIYSSTSLSRSKSSMTVTATAHVFCHPHVSMTCRDMPLNVCVCHCHSDFQEKSSPIIVDCRSDPKKVVQKFWGINWYINYQNINYQNINYHNINYIHNIQSILFT